MKKWTLLFITNKGIVRGIPFSERAVLYTIIILSIFLGALTYVTIEGTRKKALLNEYSKLELKRQEYVQKLGKIKEDMSVLSESLFSVGKNNEVLSLTSKLEPVDNTIKQMGIGGFPSRNKEFYSLDLDSSVRSLEKQVAKISNLVELERLSFRQAGGKLGELQNRLSHVPSIWPTIGHVTSDFGYRTHPITRKREFHKGFDIANRPYTPVIATADGTVKSVRIRGGYGRTVEIDHGYGITTRYAHLAKSYVSPGQKVKRGQKIAAMGSTGFVTGTHLHYEVRVLGRAVDPMNYFDTFKYVY
jgi:murein DD-endopeptidase MepM/ murein hydrolase activator NlpD